MKRRSRPSKALMGRQLKEATERQEAAQKKAAAKFAAEAQRLQPLTWAEAQRIVEFIVDGKIWRHSIYDELPIVRVDAEKDKEKDASSKERDDLDNTVSSEKHNTSETRGRPRKQPTKKTLRASNVGQKQRIAVPEAKFELLEDCVKVAPRKNVRANAPYFKFTAHLEENSDQKVEYDLDDQDAFWLKALNEQRRQERLPLVSESSFEAIIDKLEKAAHFEALNSGRHNDTGVDEDAVCSICLDGDCLNANAILFCDMCNLAVHQECYGVPYIPEGQWLCRRCLESPSLPVSCCLCPNKGGAFKRTDDGRWAHVVCALWIPEVSFSNSVFLEPIEGVNNIPPARWRLRCYLCKKSGVGAAIQCHRQHCYSAFHVTCAIQAGLFMRIDSNPLSEDRIKRTAYCDTHTPPNSDAVPMISHGTSDGERSSSNSPNAMGRLMKKRQKIRQARKLLAQHQSCNTQVVINVPTISEASLQSISAQHQRIAGKSDLMRQILAYWQLKRKSRCGVPLIRRLHVSSSSAGHQPLDYLKENPGMDDDSSSNANSGGLISFAPNLAELANSSDPFIREHVHQLRTFRLLRQNLERVRLLIELVHKRERMKRDVQKLTMASLDHQLAPFNMVLRSLLGKLRTLDKRDLFEMPVSAKAAPTYYRVIKKPMCFSKMEERLDEDDYSTIDEFEHDFNLIVDNCMSFNPKTTVFHRSAVELRNTASPVFSEARQYISSAEFDAETGMYLSTLQSLPPPSNNQTSAISPMEGDEAVSEQAIKEEEEQQSGMSKSESPQPRTRRQMKPSSNSIEALLPQSVRDGMPVEEQLKILTENLDAAVRTGQSNLVSQLRREVQTLKRKIPGYSGGSERCSSASTTASPSKLEQKDETKPGGVENGGPVTRHRNSLTTGSATSPAGGSPSKIVTRKRSDSRTNSPMSTTRSPTPGASSNGLLVIASPSSKSNLGGSSPRIPPLVSSTPVVAGSGSNSSTNLASNQQPRISTRRSAAQAGIQLPSVFGISPPPYKHRRVSSTTKSQSQHNLRTTSPVSGGPTIRVGTPSSGGNPPYSPTLKSNGSFDNNSHGEDNNNNQAAVSPPSTPGVNRRTAVLFQGKKRCPVASGSTVGSSPHHVNGHLNNGVGGVDKIAGHSLGDSPCSSPTLARSPSSTSLVGGAGGGAGVLTANGAVTPVNGLSNGNSPTSNGANALTVNNHNYSGHDHDKVLRRLSSSSAESFRAGSSLFLAPLSEFATSRSPSTSLTVPRRLSPRIPPASTPVAVEPSASTSSQATTSSNTVFELSDSDEELLADLRKKRRHSTQRDNNSNNNNNNPASSVPSATSTTEYSASRRSRRSSAASGISNPASNLYSPRSFDVVWVHSSSPSCPGLVVDPSSISSSPSNGSFSLLKRLLPTMPSSEMLASKPQSDQNSCLVFHFDAKQSWRWVSSAKLEPLDPSISLNELHLPPIAQDSYRRACLIAGKISPQVVANKAEKVVSNNNNNSSAPSSRSVSPACN